MARAWARGRGGSARPEDAPDAATAALMRHRAKLLGGDDASAIEIGPDDADAVRLFFALGTQWQRAGMAGVRVGLDYSRIAPTAALLDLEVGPALFDDLQLMEGAALIEASRQ